jgi:molecular chaperone GrpE (heat shock protein)
VNRLSRLGRLLGMTPLPADVSEELAALRQQVAEFTQAQLDDQRQRTALHDTLDKLDKQIARAGKELFKTNSLAEAQQQSVKTLLDQLRETNTLRERELTQLREQLISAHSAGRWEVITQLLSVLDGLTEALTAGQQLLAESAVPDDGTDSPPQPVPFLRRMSGAWQVLKGNSLPAQAFQPAVSLSQRDTLAAWLTGLELVSDRLLDILANAGVHPIETDGVLFDPNQHIAIEAVASTNGTQSGTIVQETRRGYLAGDTVLRYAEVIVAR